MSSFLLLGAAMVTALVLDGLWLGLIMSNFYKTQLSGFLRFKSGDQMDPILWAAGIVYLLIPAGVVLFVLPKVSAENWVSESLGWGFLFGLVIYGVYDFTNYSLIKAWPVALTLVDFVWGGILCAGVSLVTAWLAYR